MNVESRENNFVIQMIGANHCGKSTISKRIMSDWRSTRPEMVFNTETRREERKYKVVAFDPKLQFKGLADEFILPDKYWAAKLCKLRNALIVLDDYKILVPEYKATPGMFELFAGRWHYNLDFIISCHSPGHVIETIIDYITEYYIFHTKAREGKFEQKMPNSETLIYMSQTINKYVAIYGMGKHPLDKNFTGQRFPYMVFDTTKAEGRPRGYNIRKDFIF